MKIHKVYMKRLGISEKQVFAVKPALDNLSYTNYMLSIASNGTPMEIVDAILACSWSYAEIFVNCSRYELGFWEMSWRMRA